jgi:hypothetical protein
MRVAGPATVVNTIWTAKLISFGSGNSGFFRFAWLLVPACVLFAGQAAAADKPNVLFLLSDDHSYPYLGCYGCPDVRTPNLDRLAEGPALAATERLERRLPHCRASRTGRQNVRRRAPGGSTSDL